MQVSLASFCACSSPVEDSLEVLGLFVVILEVHGQVRFEAISKHHPNYLSAKKKKVLQGPRIRVENSSISVLLRLRDGAGSAASIIAKDQGLKI